MIDNFERLNKVEVEIIWFFVLREIKGEGEWYVRGRKGLACEINRHEKSVAVAIDSLIEKEKMITKKKENKLWIKHTLTNNELYSRMAFIDPCFCYAESEQELKTDLLKEIGRIEKEIVLTKEFNNNYQEQDKEIDTILQKITEGDIVELVENFSKTTYENSNSSTEEIVEEALQNFRIGVYANYDEGIGREETYNRFWSETNE